MTEKDKILVYVHGWFIHFGIAKALKEKHPCDIFAVIDFDDKAKKFFDIQNILDFEKFWHYKENALITKQKPDMNYLKSFEKKYNINLWSIVYTDKTFYRYNEFYKFSQDEILSLLEQECKFFERILDESKPDFYLTYHTQTHHEHLLYEMCRARGIRVLMLSPAKVSEKFMISQDGLLLDDFIDQSQSTKHFTQKDLENFLKENDARKYLDKIKNASFESRKTDRYKYVSKFFLSTDSSNYDTRYSYYGRTKYKVLSKKISRFIKRKQRQSFINKNLQTEIPSESSFVYFPLHYEPERVLLATAPFYDNQLAVITSIAKSIPIGYQLFVKEHPMQGTIGWRDVSFYKYIMELPNVKLIHPSVSHEKILPKCSLVVTIAGTTGLEAAFHNKPTILFSDQVYSKLPFVYRITKLEELPDAIRKFLNKPVDFNALGNLIELLENNSVKFELDIVGADFSYRFGFKGPVMDAELPINEVKSFLDKHKDVFEKLATEHIKKIKQHKENLSNTTSIKTVKE